MANVYKYDSESLKFIFEEYREDIKSKGFNKPVYNNQLDKVVQMLVPRQMSNVSFCLFAGIDPRTLDYYADLNRLSEEEKEEIKNIRSGDKTEEYKELSERVKLFLTASRIREEIQDNRIAAAEAGVTNAGLVARIYNINDTVNVNNTGTKETININIDGKKVDLT